MGNANSFFDDIFSHDPFFSNAFGSAFSNNHHQNNTNNNHPFQSMFQSPFGGGDEMFSSSFSSFGGGGGANVMSQSISTSYINGKKVTTKKMTKNGQTIVEKYENDELIQKSINGKDQKLEAISYGNGSQSGSS